MGGWYTAGRGGCHPSLLDPLGDSDSSVEPPSGSRVLVDERRSHARRSAATGEHDTGYFWFFDEDNVEVVLEVLDACVLNDNFWFFAARLTDVEAEITVTDTVLGTERTFANPLGTAFAPIQETSLLPCG
jgi:hypothetical protein